MKKNLLITLILALALSLALFSCGGGDCTHTDEDENLICDKCGEELDEGGEEEEEEPLECQHSDIDGNLLCDECGEAVPESLHTHDFSRKVVETGFMAAASTCKSAAKYYFTCLCGECGSETFEDGEPLVFHTVRSGRCVVCDALECTRGLALSLNADGKGYTVTGIGECTSSEVVIGIYNDMSVTEIAPYAFKNAITVRDVNITSTVKVIGESAFQNCSNLESVTIPDSITAIGPTAFYACTSLQYVYAADLASWLEISFESSLANPLAFASLLFLDGEQVVDLVIPDGTRKIGNNAFYGYSALETVVIPNTVKSIGAGAFADCDSLSYNEYDNAYYLGNESNPYLVLVSVKDTDITSCAINENTKIIHSHAFAYCKNSFSIDIPESVTEIGMAAFYDSPLLISVKLPSGITKIDYNTFCGCSSLTALVIPDSVTEIGEAAFSGCASLSSINIPSGVTKIGEYAFYGCASLTKLSIPDSVVSLGQSAFANCTALSYNEYDNAYYLGNESNPYFILVSAKSTEITSCTVNGGTKYIMPRAFCGCQALVSVTLPDGLIEIGRGAFEDAISLKSIQIPASVTSIGERAFLNCASISEFSVAAENTAYKSEDGILYSKDGSVLIQYPAANNRTAFTPPTSVTVLGEYSFAYAENLESLTLHEGILKVGYNAFSFCEIKHLTAPMDLISMIPTDSLVSLVITSGTKIPSYAFSGVTSLVSVTIPESVYEIGDGAFSGCVSLESITIPSGVTKIGASAFLNCTSLTSATFEVTDGWYATYYSSESSGTNIPKVDLENPATAAQYLTSTYVFQYIKRSSYSILDKLPF